MPIPTPIFFLFSDRNHCGKLIAIPEKDDPSYTQGFSPEPFRQSDGKRKILMKMQVQPARKVSGELRFPGDKSISHRLALLGGIAHGVTVIDNFASSADCHSTLGCLESLGVKVQKEDPARIIIQGAGSAGLKASEAVLDAGNSGSTIRMLSGILAGQAFVSRISGDDSLCRRPMKRIILPLEQMGARIEARESNFPPLEIHGGALSSIEYLLPVASAQVKSAILLAGLYARGKTTVIEPAATRNHTELALIGFGVPVEIEGNRISLEGGAQLHALSSIVPGDISSAAFFVVAASLLPDSELILRGIGLNPGRRGILDLLIGMGASIELLDKKQQGGEPTGDVRVRSAQLKGGRIDGPQIPGIIDEIPILAILGTQTEEGLTIRDARELRVKESDRIRMITENLRAMGATVDEYEDGFFVPGRQKLKGAAIQTSGDHRIAMAFAVAGLISQGETEIIDAECAAVSFPEFYQVLSRVTQH
jgi:3-phosphoshikimate 1-carboxyvinyltransferase